MNYHIDGKQAISHITALLNALGERRKRIIYLKTADIGRQLEKAHMTRNQSIPTNDQIAFWKQRYTNDMLVLSNIKENYHVFDVSDNGCDSVRTQIVKSLINAKEVIAHPSVLRSLQLL